MKNNAFQRITHPIPYVCPSNAHWLILGSFPSVKSRETAFYYGHPQNRFWPLLAKLFHESVPSNTEEKTALLYRHGIALWDVIGSCEIIGSSDTSIRNVQPNDLSALFLKAPITRVVCNGATAGKLYHKYLFPDTKIPADILPSTSPANASWSMERLAEAWCILLQHEL